MESRRNDSDSPEYLQEWAKALIAAIGKRAARKIQADYKAISENPRVAKSDRAIAEKRRMAIDNEV